jgi:5-oxoprolinase (ATP-hydrolysing)
VSERTAERGSAGGGERGRREGAVRPAAAGGIWRLAVDTGGTFTDCLAVDPEGRLRRAKVLSTAALRTRIVARLGEDSIRLRPIGGPGGRGAGGCPPLPAGFFAGCALCLLGPAGPALASGAELRVLASGAEGEGGPDAGGETGPDAAGGPDGVASRPAGELARLGATLRLDRPLPDGDLTGAAVELRAAEEAPVLAARLVTGTPPGRPLPPLAMRLATTRGTNALLERKGAPVALFVTRGFADLLRIGTQQRPELFRLDIERPAPLYQAVVEVGERLAADGSVLVPLDLATLRGAAGEQLAAGVRCAAVALLHSYRNPDHEREVGALLRALGFTHVALSAELAPLIKLLPRAETAVVDAYLAPLLADYLAAVAGALPSGALHVMTSAGGLVRAAAFRAKDSLLSGPAGGVVGAARAGLRSGFDRVIAFDMGGTSTDVARFDGDFEYLFEHRVGDAHLVAPALAIESVAAGGGSICSYTGDRLRVGPESAGARPGPACYGAGGPLTLTDVNLLLGRLDPGRFEIPLDPGAAEHAAAALLVAVEEGEGAAVAPAEGEGGQEGVAVPVAIEGGQGGVAIPVAGEGGQGGAVGSAAGEGGQARSATGREEMLAGLLAIADERMAEAIRGISLRRGYDPSQYALVAFGGAGAQHACAVAALLGIDTVLVPADAGLLSALGLAEAVVERFAQRQVLAPLAEVASRLDGWLDELGREAAAAVAAEGVAPGEIEVRRRIVALRFAGQESTLAVDYAGAAGLAASFAAAYRDVYGYDLQDTATTGEGSPARAGPAAGRAIEVESLRVVASSSASPAPPPATVQGPAPGGAWSSDADRAPGGDRVPRTDPAAGVDRAPGGDRPPGTHRPPGQLGAAPTSGTNGPPGTAPSPGLRRAWLAGSWRELPAYERASLAPGAVFEGPALVLEDHTATWVAEGWSCRLDDAGALVLRRGPSPPGRPYT